MNEWGHRTALGPGVTHPAGRGESRGTRGSAPESSAALRVIGHRIL